MLAGEVKCAILCTMHLMLARHDALMTGVYTPRQTTSANVNEMISALHALLGVLAKMDARGDRQRTHRQGLCT